MEKPKRYKAPKNIKRSGERNLLEEEGLGLEDMKAVLGDDFFKPL